MTYKKALFHPDVSWAELIDEIDIPDRLYKFQYFYSENGEENKFWKNNMQGEFHLSLACEFEDTNDCRPYINKMDVKQCLNDILKKSKKVEQSIIKSAIKQFEEVFDENIAKEIVHNYQNMIRIGCFTTSFKNEKMWNKYSNCGRGFCIEYDTKKAELFSLSTLPILYTSKQYNMSLNYACSLIMEWCRQGKKRSMEEHLQKNNNIYEKIIKTAYIPLFLKNAEKWSFEKEYRMFVLKKRKTPSGMLKMEDVLDCTSIRII